MIRKKESEKVPWPTSVRFITTWKKEKFMEKIDSPAESPVAQPVYILPNINQISFQNSVKAKKIGLQKTRNFPLVTERKRRTT